MSNNSVNGFNNPIFIIDTVTNERLKLQWVPKEIDYTPESEFVKIASPGRNNPFYHYGGSEDTLVLELDWHSTDNTRAETIANCRWIESFTKNDGWEEGPHPVILSWGENLFNQGMGEAWLIVSAPYKLSQFDKPHDMFPVQAYQTITLKRITEFNRSRNDIKLVRVNLPASDNSNPDVLGNNIIGSFQKPMKPLVDENLKEALKNGNITPFDQNRFKNPRRSALTRIGTQIAESALNYFANQKIFGALDAVGKKATEIEALGNKLPQL